MAELSGDIVKTFSKILIVLVLIGVLLYILTFTGTIKCKTVPGWCNIYYSVKGKPTVAIVHGDNGLGDPFLLQQLLQNPEHAGISARTIPIETISLGNLKDYELVIVDRARKMSAEQMKMFIDYANSGGNLVWTGDAGAELENEENYLYEDERFDGNQQHVIIGPWSRKFNNKMVLLDKTLSVQFKENYCNIGNQSACLEEQENCAGKLITVDSDHPLTRALRPELTLCFYGKNGPALVEPTNTGLSKTLLSVDFGSNVNVDGENIGRTLPVIISSSELSFLGLNVGENVFYYAIPPELLSDSRLSDEHRYDSILGNLYFGILFG